jgi:hypothetical protein
MGCKCCSRSSIYVRPVVILAHCEAVSSSDPFPRDDHDLLQGPGNDACIAVQKIPLWPRCRTPMFWRSGGVRACFFSVLLRRSGSTPNGVRHVVFPRRGVRHWCKTQNATVCGLTPLGHPSAWKAMCPYAARGRPRMV